MRHAAIGLLAGCCLLSFPSHATPQHTITTFAGGGPHDVSALAAAVSMPASVAVDASGNIYIAAQAAARIFKVDAATGQLSVFAGTGTRAFGGDGGPAVAAHLSGPSGVAVDAAGNVYIVDWENVRLRRVDALTGVITTVVGNGTNGFAGDGGPAANALLGGPNAVAVDAAGDVYIADTGNNRIRKVSLSTGVIDTVAGVGTAGDSGDGGPATSAELRFPFGLAVGSGQLFIADSGNNRVRRVNLATGIISTVAGSAGSGFSGDGGLATSATLASPWGAAVDGTGNLWIADAGNRRVRRVVLPTGIIETVAGSGAFSFGGDGGPATLAGLSVQALAVDGAGQLYIADTSFHRIRKVDGSGVIDTVAGNGEFSFSGDGGAAVRARLNFAHGAAVDAAGNLYFADADNCRVRRVDRATGVIETVAGSSAVPAFAGDGGPATAARLSGPAGLAFDAAGNLYIADTGNNRIRRVNGAGTIETVAGTGAFGFGGDGGAATAATLHFPRAVAVDGAGTLYIADWFNRRVRKVDSAGVISTFAGNGATGPGIDGGPATASPLWDPIGVALDAAGNLYVVERVNARVRKVDAATGVITTVAGNGSQLYAGDGLLATNASFARPIAVAVDASGQLFVSDQDGHNVRKVDHAGYISTLAGTGVGGYNGDGIPAATAQLFLPQGVALDGAGNVFIVDMVNQRVRLVSNAGPSADAGPDQSVAGGASFTLDGGASSDPDGDTLRYEWRDAGNVVVSTAVALTQTLTAGSHVFTLSVSDGSLTASDSVTVTVASPFQLSVNLIGVENGGGSVDVPGCLLAPGLPSLSCGAPFPVGTEVTLTALAASESIFLGWGGACASSGTGPCTLILSEHTSVTAEFLGPRHLVANLVSNEDGAGSIQFQPSGLTCSVAPGVPPPFCVAAFRSGLEVTLTATPAPDSIFLGWGGGACSGTGPCTLILTQHTPVTAEFLGPRHLVLNLVSTDAGGGGVEMQPLGRTCSVGPGVPPEFCGQPFRLGTEVTLTATAASDSIFLGWSGGACSGTGPCTLILSQHTPVTAQFLGPQHAGVNMVGIENGGGSVEIQPAGLNCLMAPGGPTPLCGTSFPPGTEVTLTALAASESAFLGWGGGVCSGTGPCTFVLNAHTLVSAEFLGPRQLVVNLGSNEFGAGSVEIQPSGQVCSVSGAVPPPLCGGIFKPGLEVTLNATPAAGSVFLGWGGGLCSGTGTCTISMTQHSLVTAAFLGPRELQLAVLSNGGEGSVSDGSAVCATGGASPCYTYYTPGTTVTLTATAGPLSQFGGWGGACSGTTPTCVLVMSGLHPSVSATFSAAAGATPAGRNVPVTPPDQGGATPVSLDFQDVTQAGITSLTTSTPPPAGPAPPAGFGLGDPPTYYELSTTAVYSGTIEICIDYSGVSYPNERDLKLLHFENGSWTDVTTSLDTVNDVICGGTTSLSPFAVFQASVAVSIDILPGQFPNTIKLRSRGTIQTAVFSSEAFDATSIDPASVTLAGASVRTKKKGRMMAKLKDVNRDGLTDLLLQMAIEDLELDPHDTVAVLEGSTYDGRLVRGSDSVKVVR